jgi:uncharacterized sulfatase
MYDPDKLTIPAVVPGEHDRNPPHFQMTQQQKPDFTPWRETGHSIHGMRSHLQDTRELAKDVAVYYGMISLMDKHIGRMLDKLRELGSGENTVVVFSTDHGHFLGQHGLNKKGPFHYEDMIKIPFIVRWPGHVPEGRQSDAPQSLVDLAPTFLRLIGADIPRSMTGVDQSEVWLGQKKRARDHVIVEHHHEPTTIHVKTYVNDRYKITVYFNHDYGEIFDLQDDPDEVNNLWNDPDSARLKTDLLIKLLSAEMGKEPMLTPRTAGA